MLLAALVDHLSFHITLTLSMMMMIVMMMMMIVMMTMMMVMMSFLQGLGDNLHSAVIALDAVWMLDLDGVQALQEVVEDFSRAGLRVYLAGVYLVNTTGAVLHSHRGDTPRGDSQHGPEDTPDHHQRSKSFQGSFRGLGPLLQDHTTSHTHGVDSDSSKCLPPMLLSSLPSGGGAHTAIVTVTKLLTQQAFYQVIATNKRTNKQSTN